MQCPEVYTGNRLVKQRKKVQNQGIDTKGCLYAQYYTSPSGVMVSLTMALERQVAANRVVLWSDPVSLPELASSLTRNVIKVSVLPVTTMQALRLLRSSEPKETRNLRKLGALNFASATTRGGGWLGTALTQEECITRNSTLYHSLSLPLTSAYYTRERNKGDPAYFLYNDTAIVSPHVVFFKDEFSCAALEPHDCFEAVIVTCPAVMARNYFKEASADGAKTRQVHEEVVRETMRVRIRRVLAQFHEERCDAVVLGAFGCGAFGNNAEMVAGLFKEELQSREGWAFGEVLFAVAYDDTKFHIFERVMKTSFA
ncbi:hypothetical protein BC830DRAFT_1138272 [Chytriomyces sp. MP71]|nr:hypothetical protein BC830DRAFT_1138272 [Chytriomyces sp. MP71]